MTSGKKTKTGAYLLQWHSLATFLMLCFPERTAAVSTVRFQFDQYQYFRGHGRAGILEAPASGSTEAWWGQGFC